MCWRVTPEVDTAHLYFSGRRLAKALTRPTAGVCLIPWTEQNRLHLLLEKCRSEIWEKNWLKMAATPAALTPFQTHVDDAWLQVEKKDGRRSPFTILGVASSDNGDLLCASQSLAVLFKVCSASRVNHLPRFWFCFFVFHVVHEATQTSRAFFISCFTTFILRISSNRRLVFGLLKPLSVLFFFFLLFKVSTKQNTVVQMQQESIFVFCFYIYLHLFYVLVFIFFPRACEWDMSKRCNKSRTSIFDIVCILTLCWVNVVQPVIFISTVIPCRAQSVNVCVGVSFCNYCHSKPETNMYIMYKW